MPGQSCQTCEHIAVCAIRRSFNTPVKKLVKAKAEDKGLDKDGEADELAEQSLRFSELIYQVCPSAN